MGDMAMKRMILASTALLALSGAVVANPIDDARICANGVKRPAESHLPYCSRAIRSGRLGRADLALTHNNRGAILQMLGRDDEALGDFDRAIELNPGLAWSYLNRGWLFFRRDQIRRAWEDFNQAIKADPGDSKGYVNRSAIYMKTEQFDAALQDLKTALALNPRDPVAYNNRALIRQKRKQFDLAYLDSDKALAYGIDALIKKGVITPSIYMLRANYNLARGKYREVLKDMDRALGLTEFAEGHNTRAWILATSPDAEVRNGKEAIEAAHAALSLEDTGKFRDTLAAAFAETGQFKKAVAEQRYAIRLLRKNQAPEDEIASYEKVVQSYQRKQPRRMTPPKLKTTKG
jgi:tetratricopeptide (TPR) repeat protein